MIGGGEGVKKEVKGEEELSRHRDFQESGEKAKGEKNQLPNTVFIKNTKRGVLFKKVDFLLSFTLPSRKLLVIACGQPLVIPWPRASNNLQKLNRHKK